MRPAAVRLALALVAAGVPAAPPLRGRDAPPAGSPYEAIDRHALAAPPAAEESIDALAEYLTKPAKTDREKARAIFRWLTDRVAYNADDFLAGRPPGDNSAGAVLKTRKSVCAGYAALFEALARKAGLEVVTVPGSAKGYGYVAGQAAGENHAWNAVKVGGRWYGVDSTWGAGHLDPAKGFVKGLEEEWFLTPPEQLVLSHLPTDPARQFLDRPVDGDTFRRWPKVPTPLFASGFEAKAVREVLDEVGFRGLVAAYSGHAGRARVRTAPLRQHLAAGTEVEVQVEAKAALDVAVINDQEWHRAKPVDGVYRFRVTPKKGTLVVGVRYGDKGKSYTSLLEYVVE